MDPIHSVATSPSRLSERRGKPELARLEPPSSVVRHAASKSTDTYSSTSSVPALDASDTPAMSAPVTPTDISPIKAVTSFGVTSIVGSIREEDELNDWNCLDCRTGSGGTINGLGLDVASALENKQRDMAYINLDSTRPGNFPFSEPSSATDYHLNEKLAPVTLPPTPPSHVGERAFGYLVQVSPISQKIDAEAFSSASPLAPQSPQRESRAAAILSKVVPSKLRASFKRRLSSPSQPTNVPPPPPVPSIPRYLSSSVPGTPPDDRADFGGLFVNPAKLTLANGECLGAFPAPEVIPPPLANPFSSTSCGTQTDAHMGSARTSPRMGTKLSVSTDVSPEAVQLGSPAGFTNFTNSPLARSPLKSPSIASASQSSLSIGTGPIQSHKKCPSIDPATPLAPPSPLLEPNMPVTEDSLKDMTEQRKRERAGYEATLARMINSGWSSPQEIRNVERQKEDKERIWEERITEFKKILDAMRRNEVKDSAMSSVSSLGSVGSAGSGSAPFTNSHVTSAATTTLTF